MSRRASQDALPSWAARCTTVSTPSKAGRMPSRFAISARWHGTPSTALRLSAESSARSPISFRSARPMSPLRPVTSARRVGARRRGRGRAPAASPARLNRRPAGGAQDEGVPLRRSAPPPPPPPAPIAPAALVNHRGYVAASARSRIELPPRFVAAPISGLRGTLDDLPVRVFPRHRAAPELPVVAAAHPHRLAVGTRSREEPFRDAEVPADPVAIVVVVHVGQSLETRGEAFAHGRLARVALAPGLGSARHLQRAVLGEELHDRVEIMSIEGGGDGLERVDRGGGAVSHERSSCRRSD